MSYFCENYGSQLSISAKFMRHNFRCLSEINTLIIGIRTTIFPEWNIAIGHTKPPFILRTQRLYTVFSPVLCSNSPTWCTSTWEFLPPKEPQKGTNRQCPYSSLKMITDYSFFLFIEREGVYFWGRGGGGGMGPIKKIL